MSLSKLRIGVKPSGAASPPQNGSTYLLFLNGVQSCKRSGTSQRLPPAHFKGGLASGRLFLLGAARFPFTGRVESIVKSIKAPTNCNGGILVVDRSRK